MVGRLLSYWEGNVSGAMLNFGGVGVGRQAFFFLKWLLVWGHVNFSGGALEVVTTKERSNIYTFKYTWCYLQNRLLGLFYDPHFELPNWFCCFSSCAPSPFQPRKFPFITGVSTNRPVVVRHQDLFGQQPGHRLLGALLKARSLNGVTCGLATVSRNVRWCHGVTRVGWRFFVFVFAKLKRCRTTGRYWKTGDLWMIKQRN